MCLALATHPRDTTPFRLQSWSHLFQHLECHHDSTGNAIRPAWLVIGWDERNLCFMPLPFPSQPRARSLSESTFVNARHCPKVVYASAADGNSGPPPPPPL